MRSGRKQKGRFGIVCCSAAAILIAILYPVRTSASGDPDKVGINVIDPIDNYGYVSEYAFDTVEEAGAGWIRLKAWWVRLVQEDSSQFDEANLGYLMDSIQNAHSRGLKVLLTFQTIPIWAEPVKDPECRNNPGAWLAKANMAQEICAENPSECCSYKPEHARLVYMLVSRLLSRLKEADRLPDAYELWNEPDLPVFWYGTKEEFKDLILDPGARAINNSEGYRTIVGPGALYCNSDYTPLACDYVDKISTHMNKKTVDEMRSFIGGCRSICPGSEKEVWVTEYSWLSSVEPGEQKWGGESEQAIQLSDSVKYVSGSLPLNPGEYRPERLFVFAWLDKTWTGNPLGDGKTGITERRWDWVAPPRPKKAYWAMRDELAGEPPPLVRDTFAADPETSQPRYSGKPIDGTHTEIGSKLWVAFPTAVIASNDLITLHGGGAGSIPFDPRAYTDSSVLVLDVDVSVGDAQWIGVGFSNPGGVVGLEDPGTGQIWGKLGTSGEFSVLADGDDLTVVDPTFPSPLYSNGLNHIRIEYDLNRNLAEIWFNKPVDQNPSFVKDLDSLSFEFQPDIYYFGFNISSPGKGVHGIDNLSITMNGPAQEAPYLISIDEFPSEPVQIGEDFHLTVSSDGAVPMTYRWYRGSYPLSDNSRIHGSSTRRLSITEAVQSDSGSYRCKISNHLGWNYSPSKEVSVYGDIEISVHPLRQAGFEGEAVTFELGASGPPPLEYQWLKNGVEIQDDPGKVSGAQSTSLTVSQLSLSDEGDYSCRVSNGSQSVVSNEAELDVITPFVRDTFSGVQQGIPINGRMTELGYKQWYSNQSTVGSTDSAVTYAPPDNIHATVPYLFAQGYMARVSARLLADGSDWVGVGFTENPNYGVWQDGKVWVWIKPDGTFKLCLNGNGGLSPQPITNFVSAGYNSVTVGYNRIADQVEVWINGVREYGPAFAGLGSNPQINHAGVFSLAPTAGQTKVDDFTLSHYCPGCI